MVNQAAVVLAAGQGTRMKSRLPKVLHRVCGTEMVRLVLGAARDAGLDSTAVVVGPDSESVRDALGNSVSYVEQREPLGTGHALLQARGLFGGVGTIAVLNGDVPLITPDTLQSMLRAHAAADASITLLTATMDSPQELGRVVRDASGRVRAVVEASEAGDEAREIAEVNGGVYCFRSSWLWPNLASLSPSSGGEVYLTDLVSAAYDQGMTVESVQARSPEEIRGVNTRVQLAAAEGALRQRVRERWMLAGVTLSDPTSVYIDVSAELGPDTVLLPNTHITGDARIGPDCVIGPNTIVDESVIGSGCHIVASVVKGSVLENDVEVGPFSHIRQGSHLETGVHIGSSVEVKKSRLGRGTKSGHFSYLGDADVGADVNIGAGTVTCNFDGASKHPTHIGEGAFIGCDSMLVAPVSIGARAETGAGSVVTQDVEPETLVVGVPARVRSRNRPPKEG